MFGLFSTPEKKMRATAEHWLELADKVWAFRRDVLPAPDSAELVRCRDTLRGQVAARADAAALKVGVEALEGVLRRTGGAFYPRGALAENVEFFLMAAIVILGFRTYFAQNFKIPTNSMWPTYNGMTAEIFASPAAEPNLLAQAGRLAAFGATPHRLDAPTDGELLIPIGGREARRFVHSHNVAGHSWLVFPATLREYTLLVGDRPVTVRLPSDFDFDWVVYDALLSRTGNYTPQRFIEAWQRILAAGQVEHRVVDGESVPCIRTGKIFRAGERLLSFDELTGDVLFVDRFSYNFIRPRVGSGFVFYTQKIPLIPGEPTVYIKRLVGTPGDTLEVQGSTLMRNGAPIGGAAAFDDNAHQRGKYPGYEASGLLAPGQTVHVEPGNFFAMGDNSPDSGDGRVWGFVPAKEVVGRPLFVYYPFASHWGPAK